jgi:Mrp family chromosome partitioning ATPase
VLAVSDAQVVARLVDGAILVVRPEKNHRRLVVRACESFSATGSIVLGIVANGLSAESSAGYGYGYGYGYGHEEEGDDDGEVVTLSMDDIYEDAGATEVESQASASRQRQTRAA